MNPQPLHSKTPANRLRYFVLAILFSAFTIYSLSVAFGFFPDSLHLSDSSLILFFACTLPLMSAIVCANMFSINSGSRVMQQLATFEMEEYTKCQQYSTETVSINPSEIFWTKYSEEDDSPSVQGKKDTGGAVSRSYTSKTRTFAEFHCLFSKN